MPFRQILIGIFIGKPQGVGDGSQYAVAAEGRPADRVNYYRINRPQSGKHFCYSLTLLCFAFSFSFFVLPVSFYFLYYIALTGSVKKSVVGVIEPKQ